MNDHAPVLAIVDCAAGPTMMIRRYIGRKAFEKGAIFNADELTRGEKEAAVEMFRHGGTGS